MVRDLQEKLSTIHYDFSTKHAKKTQVVFYQIENTWQYFKWFHILQQKVL